MPIDNKEQEQLNPLEGGDSKAKNLESNLEGQSLGGEAGDLAIESRDSSLNNEGGSDLRDNQENVGSKENLPVNAVYNNSGDPAIQVYKKIEKILEEDLADLYNSLNYKEKMIFKAKGEEVAKSIFQLIYKKSKVKVKKIIKLIRSWLKLIPGINKFFLEQEAKIKADKIIYLVENDKKIQF